MSRGVLEGIQEDFEARLLAAPYFSDVAIIQQRRALTADEINGQKGVLKGRASKVGACVLVKLPVVDVVDPNVPGPRTAVVQSLLVLEHPEVNSKSTGTGKTAEQLAIAALQLFHHFVPYGVSQAFVGDRDAIIPDASFAGLRAYLVTLTSFVALRAPSKAVRPVISFSADTAPATVTITSATPGAAIYYTVDESYPSSANAAATLFSAPFSQETAATIRAAAQISGSDQSDIAQLTLL